MAVPPDKLRQFVWLSVPPALYFGSRTFFQIHEGAAWEAAASATMGGLLILALALSRQGALNVRHGMLCLVPGVIGMAGWLGAAEPLVRIVGFIVSAIALITMMVLPRTARQAVPRMVDDVPTTLDLSK